MNRAASRFRPAPVATTAWSFLLAAVGLGGCGHVHARVSHPGGEAQERQQSIAVGAQHRCAIRRDGELVCWGHNEFGQLGIGTTTTYEDAVVVPTLRDVLTVAAGAKHTCAATRDGATYCWGNNAFGQLGDGTRSLRSQPTLVAGLGEVVALAAGLSHTCALDRMGRVTCWGSDRAADATAARPRLRTRPGPIDLGGAASLLAAGAMHTCAVVAGRVSCWGSNGAGALGRSDADVVYLDAPTPIAGVPNDVVALGAGGTRTCAVSGTGTTWCWGGVADGLLRGPWWSDPGILRRELDEVRAAARDAPFTPDGATPLVAAHDAEEVSVSSLSTCWLRHGSMTCAGRGYLGDGDSWMPRERAFGQAHALSLGGVACYRAADDHVTCLHDVVRPRLAAREPVRVPLEDVRAIFSYRETTCAVFGADSRVACWGFEHAREPERREVARALAPWVIPGLTHVRTLDISERSVCAVVDDATVVCAHLTNPRDPLARVHSDVPLVGMLLAEDGYSLEITAHDANGVLWGARPWQENDISEPVAGDLAFTRATDGPEHVRSMRRGCAATDDGAQWMHRYGEWYPLRGLKEAMECNLDEVLGRDAQGVFQLGSGVAISVPGARQAWIGGNMVVVQTPSEFRAFASRGTALARSVLRHAEEQQGEKLEMPAGTQDVVITNATICARTSGGELYCWGDAVTGAIGDGQGTGERFIDTPHDLTAARTSIDD